MRDNPRQPTEFSPLRTNAWGNRSKYSGPLHFSKSRCIHASDFTAEVELTGDSNWVRHATFRVKEGETLEHPFPDAFSAYWIRFTADQDSTVSAQLTYK